MSLLELSDDSNKDKDGNYFSKIESFFNKFERPNENERLFNVYREKVESLTEDEEKEIQEGLNEIAEGKYRQFDGIKQYLKYLDNPE
jgi:hypothetical protein